MVIEKKNCIELERINNMLSHYLNNRVSCNTYMYQVIKSHGKKTERAFLTINLVVVILLST